MSLSTLNRALCSTVLAGALVAGGAALADPIPKGWEAYNMKPIGYSSVDERGGIFKLAIRHVGDRWYMYAGHLWHHGWSIIDVTDPANMHVVKFVDGPLNTWTIQMTLHDNLMITALQNCPAEWGCDPKRPQDEGVLI